MHCAIVKHVFNLYYTVMHRYDYDYDYELDIGKYSILRLIATLSGCQLDGLGVKDASWGVLRLCVCVCV